MAEKLSPSQIYTLLLKGGFNHDQAVTMTAIAQAESGRDPAIKGDLGLQDGKWGPSVGLFQIRTLKAETGTGSDRDIQRLLDDPQAQVEAALNISNHGRNFRPWSTFTHGSYRQYLDVPLDGDAPLPAGSGAGHRLSSTLPDPFAMTPVSKPVKVADADGDGLTDRFERLLGTDLHSADSDHDGLTDTYETTVSHTDPLLDDTDHDGVADAVEVARHTDAGTAELPEAARKAGFGGFDSLDSDHDGLSDGYEKQHGSDPFKADTDGDGLSDAQEDARGSDAHDLDSNHDGLTDGFAAEHGLPTDPLDPPDDADHADLLAGH